MEKKPPKINILQVSGLEKYCIQWKGGWNGRPRRQGEEEGQLGEIRDEGKGYPGNLSN